MWRVCGDANSDVRWRLFDPFALFDDGFNSAEVGVGGRYVVQAFVTALMIVLLEERLVLGF